MQTEQLQAQLDRALDMQRWMLDIARGVAAGEGLEGIPYLLMAIAKGLGASSARLLIDLDGVWRAFSSTADGDHPELDGMLLEDLEHRAASGVVSYVRGQDQMLAGKVADTIGSVHALRLNRPDGQPQGLLWVALTEPRELDESERAFLLVANAQAEIVLERARETAAVREQQAALTAILDGAPDPVLMIDRELRLQLANRAAREAFGVGVEQGLGQPLPTLNGLANLASLFEEDDAAGATNALARVEITGDNGKTYTPTVVPQRHEDEALSGWVIVLRDISPLKRLNDNMSEFVSRVSHDLRSPLTFMKGYLDMLGMVGSLNDKQMGFVDKITNGVVQMSDMVEKVLEAARIDPVTGRYTLSREQCDMVELVEKIVAALAEPAARARLQLTHTIDPGAPVMNLDRGMISSAFTNLVENAIKYTPEGGTVDVTLAVDREHNDLVFQVKDNGLGISEEDQRNLFQRHVRVHRQEWVRIKGSGLGLFIVKNVAQRHGGDAWVVSAAGQGSTFFVSIPMEGSNMIAGDAASRDQSAAGR